MDFRKWWGRLWTRTDWIGLISAILATLVLLAFTQWASITIGELQSLVEQRTQEYMVDDPDLIWGICSRLPEKSKVEGNILFWNFSMTCDDIHLEQFHNHKGLVIVNPYTTFTFLNNLTRNVPRKCYDVNAAVKHPNDYERNCTALFEEVNRHAEWEKDDYMTLQDVQDHGNDYLRDVISLPIDEITHKIVFRMATWNTSVDMVVDDDNWFDLDGNADELIMKHQSAICHKDIPDGEVPPHWISSYRCVDGVESSYRDNYRAIFQEIKTNSALHPVRGLGISGSYDDWYAIYTGMLGGFFASCATVVALSFVALLGATFNIGRNDTPSKPAEVLNQVKEHEKEKRLEAMSRQLEAVYMSLVGARETSGVIVEQQGHLD